MLGLDKSIIRSADCPRRARAMTQMLRRLAFFLGGGKDLDRAAGLLHRLGRGLRRPCEGQVQRRGQFALGEQADAVELALGGAGFDQRVLGDVVAGRSRSTALNTRCALIAINSRFSARKGTKSCASSSSSGTSTTGSS